MCEHVLLAFRRLFSFVICVLLLGVLLLGAFYRCSLHFVIPMFAPAT